MRVKRKWYFVRTQRLVMAVVLVNIINKKKQLCLAPNKIFAHKKTHRPHKNRVRFCSTILKKSYQNAYVFVAASVNHLCLFQVKFLSDFLFWGRYLLFPFIHFVKRIFHTAHNFLVSPRENIRFYWIFSKKRKFYLPTVVYRTNVSLFSSIASTANFSQYCAVMMAIVGCLFDAMVGICLTTLISVSSWWIRVKELYSIDLIMPRALSDNMICRTSSSDQP